MTVKELRKRAKWKKIGVVYSRVPGGGHEILLFGEHDAHYPLCTWGVIATTKKAACHYALEFVKWWQKDKKVKDFPG